MIRFDRHWFFLSTTCFEDGDDLFPPTEYFCGRCGADNAAADFLAFVRFCRDLYGLGDLMPAARLVELYT